MSPQDAMLLACPFPRGLRVDGIKCCCGCGEVEMPRAVMDMSSPNAVWAGAIKVRNEHLLTQQSHFSEHTLDVYVQEVREKEGRPWPCSP